MNHVKQIDIVRKQNFELLQKVQNLQMKIDNMEIENKEDNERVCVLIHDLEDIKNRWVQSINELEKKKVQYSNLIYKLQEIKGIMESMNFKIPWYKRIWMKIWHNHQ